MADRNTQQNSGRRAPSAKTQAKIRKGYIRLAFRVLVLTAIGWLLLTKVLLIMQAEDNEMHPAIDAGDLLLAYRLQREYSKNDVVIYQAEGKRKIGRIAACGGDVVQIDDSGTLLVNGSVQSGKILFSTYAREGAVYPFEVPEGCVFILCDYRTEGVDSRDYGAISLSDVEGKVITILRRRSI